jgi:exodeoxyribonuclease VII large subunit
LTNATPIRLSDLAGAIRNSIADIFGSRIFWVLADVANYKYYQQKNHHYFDLVEKGPKGITTKLNAVAWWEGDKRIRAFEKQTGQKFGNDIHVLASVSVEYHVIYGLKLTLLDIDSRFTLGQLEEQRQATLDRLLNECADSVRKVGDRYVTANMELTFRKVIQRIAVIASESSAGFEDFMHSFQTKGNGYHFHFDNYFTRVQGQDNADDVVARLHQIKESKNEYDAIVIIRGGGAQTDLLIFDDYNIARTVAGMDIPIITGIGHLRNETITDMMAHTVTKTPTECAEFIISHNRCFEEEILQFQKHILLRVQQMLAVKNREIQQLDQRIIRSARTCINTGRQKLSETNQRVTHNARRHLFAQQSELMKISTGISMRPQSMIEKGYTSLSQAVSMLTTHVAHVIQNRHARLEHLTSLLKMSSPEEVLKRGFAIVKLNDRIITDPSELGKGDQLQVILKDTEIETTITAKNKYHGKDFTL